jgi:hypothetical protein
MWWRRDKFPTPPGTQTPDHGKIKYLSVVRYNCWESEMWLL